MICSRCDVVLTEENQPPSWRNKNCNFCKDCSKENNQLSNPDRMFVNGKYIKKTHPLYKAGNYKSFGDLAFGSLNSYQTSSPMRNYKLVHSVYCEDRSESERSAHILAARKAIIPWSKQDNGEWFNITESQAREILKEVESCNNNTQEKTLLDMLIN